MMLMRFAAMLFGACFLEKFIEVVSIGILEGIYINLRRTFSDSYSFIDYKETITKKNTAHFPDYECLVIWTCETFRETMAYGTYTILSTFNEYFLLTGYVLCMLIQSLS